jgi:hypothetical protein
MRLMIVVASKCDPSSSNARGVPFCLPPFCTCNTATRLPPSLSLSLCPSVAPVVAVAAAAAHDEQQGGVSIIAFRGDFLKA